jgi:hypothetical protein
MHYTHYEFFSLLLSMFLLMVLWFNSFVVLLIRCSPLLITMTTGSLGTETAAAIMNELQSIKSGLGSVQNDIGPMKRAMKSLLDLTLDHGRTFIPS